MSELRGYLSPLYGRSFREFGDIVVLPKSGIQLIRREISKGLYDYIGIYPFVMATDWTAVEMDINVFSKPEDVSVTFIVDPISAPEAQTVMSGWDVCRFFKTQFVIDLSDDWINRCQKRTRTTIRKSRQINRVELLENNTDFSDKFFYLYEKNFDRLGVGRMQRLSRAAIGQQMLVPGCDVIAAYIEDELSGIMMSYDYGDWGNMHLIAFAPHNRDKSLSSYALIEKCISVLKSRGCKWANIGGSAGMDNDPNDGLFRFKKRWGGEPKSSILCGKILNRTAYERLSSFPDSKDTNFFPAYRVPAGPYDWNINRQT